MHTAGAGHLLLSVHSFISERRQSSLYIEFNKGVSASYVQSKTEVHRMFIESFLLTDICLHIGITTFSTHL